ncbi:hypothetical protein O7600_07100 [Micromonospora sp. WMMA1998]|uniref:hypothetical protein n=1 Tax=Micromonospora sp. WMMA1998 TaxID=3015167 RepID=UPI00248D1D47|nr:hypothetical protein [Micromonospora sp. WMMA1998]WBC16600.1 hypothetical protein O7600_07100 [Micromonospora sp. WMMA1998]
MAWVVAAESMRRLDGAVGGRGRFDGHEAALGVALRETLHEALRGTAAADGRPLAELCRRLGWTPEEFDALGHHLLTAVLAQRLGPDVLVRVGAMLTRARHRLSHVPPAGPHTPHREPRSRNDASRRYMVAAPPAHLPLPPDWRCTGCAAEWPCPTKQSQLLVEFGGTTAGLAVYLGTCLVAAAEDLPTMPVAEARARFLGWLPRSRH